MKVVSLSALSTGHLNPQEMLLVLGVPQGHSVAGRIMLMVNSSDTFRNRTRDLPVCSAVPQPIALPRPPPPTIRTIQTVICSCLITVSFISCPNWHIRNSEVWGFLFPVDEESISSAIISFVTVTSPRYHLLVHSRWDFSSLLEEDDNLSVPHQGCTRIFQGF